MRNRNKKSIGTRPGTAATKRDPLKVRRLEEILFSEYGELCAAQTHLFYGMVSRRFCLEISDAFYRIAAEEFRHCQRLGEAISMFGGIPAVSFGNCGFPPADQTERLEEMLDHSLLRKETSLQKLAAAMKEETDTDLCALYDRLSKEGRMHLSDLERMKRTYLEVREF